MAKNKDIDDFERLLSQATEDGPFATDPEELVEEIDMDEINSESEASAIDMVMNLSKIYFDEEFMEENPGLKKRIESWIESMRILIKMRKSSERSHDILMKNLPSQPTNASLYRSQAQIEANLLSIQKQMEETVSSMTNLLKNYQLEINFRQSQDDDKEEDKVEEKDTHRGSKTFIQQMREKNSRDSKEISGDQEHGKQMDLFTGSEKVDEFTGEVLEQDS